MRRERYVFNKQTLRYEKVVEPLSTTLLRIFGFICAAIVSAIVMLTIAHNYFPSPKERELQATINELESFIEDKASQEVQMLEKAVDNLQRRDTYVNRMVFGMNPIDENIWNGGVGGHDAYARYDIYGESGHTMKEFQERLDRIKHRVRVQSLSLDTIISTAQKKELFLQHIPTIKPVAGQFLARKVNNLSGFGPRLHPVFKVMKMHNGIDFTAPSGTEIVATGNGTVVRAERAQGFGNLVVIRHGDTNFETYYAHMKDIKVRRGEKVTRGQLIGWVGTTGTSTAPHCHYEVRLNGRPINPINYVLDGLTPQEYEALTRAAEVVNQSLH